MPAYGWHGDATLEEWLEAEPERFDLIQAVRLLEQMALMADPETALHRSLGDGAEAGREAVQMRAHVGFEFPAAEVRALDPEKTGKPELTVNLFALAGGAAPLPDWVAELLLAQERVQGMAGGRAFRDFLDIFHHRLLSLYYRIRVRHRPWLEPVAGGRKHGAPPQPGRRMAQSLLSFAGLGLAELQGRLGIADSELLPYAGLLWQQPRSLAGLERILEHALGVPVASRSLLGSWSRIEPEDRTRLGGRLRGTQAARVGRRLDGGAGTAGRNCVLGESVVLGTRVWNPQGRFDLMLGPLTLAEFHSLLPQGRRYHTLRELVRFYAGDLFEVRVHLRLQAKSASGCRLGGKRTQPAEGRTRVAEGRTRLGWTSWLKPRSSDSVPARTILLPGL